MPRQKTLLAKLITFIFIIAMGLITYWNTGILMSLVPYTPFNYEPDGIQLIAPGIISPVLFFLVWLLFALLRKFIVFPKQITKIIIFLAIAGALPSWANIFPYVWTPNVIFFWYGVLYGLAGIVCLVYLAISTLAST